MPNSPRKPVSRKRFKKAITNLRGNKMIVTTNEVDGTVIAYEPHPRGAYVTISTHNGPQIIDFDVADLDHIANARDIVKEVGDALGDMPQGDRFRLTDYGLEWSRERWSQNA